MQVLKKSLVAVMLLALVFGEIDSTVTAAREGKSMITFIDGKPLQSVKSSFKDGRKLFLPLRAVLEHMGWVVTWGPEYTTISYEVKDSKKTLFLYFNDDDDILMEDGTAYILARRLSGLTNAQVEGDEVTNTVNIVTADPFYINEEWLLNQETQTPEQEVPDLTPEESEKVNFGKYAVPPTLKALIEVAEELEREGYEIWNVIGFYPTLHHSGYLNTPFDVVAFGWTGGDGEHYGFLTDFSSAADLENAPIVMVSPMSFDQPAVVVASNIREFMRVVMIDSSLLYMGYENEQAYLKSNQEMQESLTRDGGFGDTEEDRQNKQAVLKKLEDKLKPPIISNPYKYSENVAIDREKRILVATKDKLGVTNIHPSDSSKRHSALLVDEYLEIKEVRSFLQTATYAEKLALIRDYNLETLQYEKEILATLKVEMKSMGLHDELARLQAVYRT